MESKTDGMAGSESNNIEYQEADGSYQTLFSTGNDSVVDAIIYTVATATERSPFALPVLYDTIDPDAIISIIQSSDTETKKADIVIEFQYAGCLIEVSSHGTITAHPSSCQ